MEPAAIIVLLAFSRVAKAADGTHTPELSISVYRIQTSWNDYGLARNLMAAQGVASGMFATAGVRVNWRTGQPKAGDPERPILIEITSNTPDTFHTGAFAYAYPFEGVQIRIFYDRVENVYKPRATVMVLAHVIVHEITHVLEESDQHSKEAVMKAQWTLDDFKEMAYEPLPFDPEDVSLIRRGVVERREARRTSPSRRVPESPNEPNRYSSSFRQAASSPVIWLAVESASSGLIGDAFVAEILTNRGGLIGIA